MSCREMHDALVAGGRTGETDAHIAECEDCRRLVAAMERARSTVVDQLAPVRPLPSTAALAACFAAIWLAVAVAGGFALHLRGWPVLSVLQRVVVFSLLAASAVVLSMLAAREMVPAARRARAWPSFAAVLLTTEAAFLLLFHNRGMGQFVHSGMVCLTAGLVVAVPAAVLAWAILRRGAVMDRVSAGAAIGMTAGLAGLGALELHCPNLSVWHIGVWHAGVFVVATAIAAAVAAASRCR